MPSTLITLDLRVSDNWVVDDTVNQEINPDFAQKPKPPRVGWTINTLNTPEGIKSFSPFPQNEILNDTNTLVGDYGDYKIFTVISTNGEITYGIGKHETGANQIYTFDYITKDGGIGTPATYQPVMRLNNVGLLFATISFSTLFQNFTLHIFDEKSTFDPGVLIAGDVAAVRGVFSMDLGLGANGTVIKHELTGIAISTLAYRGIASFGNYLIIWDNSTVFWSDPFDFTNFTIGGGSLAGNQKISEAKGEIISIVPFPSGLMIYCSQNIVTAVYSGDATNPWIFTELPNGTGVRLQNNVVLTSADEKSAAHYAFTSKGIVSVQQNGAQLLSDKLSAFVSSTNIEVKDIGSSLIETLNLTSTLKPFAASPTIKTHKVNFVTLLDDYLFLGTGHPDKNSFVQFHPDGDLQWHPQEEFKLFILELSTGRLSTIQGRALAVGRDIRIFTSAGFELNRIAQQGFNLSNKYVIAFAPVFDESGTKVQDEYLTSIDMGGQANLPADYQAQQPYLFRDAEVFVGDISIKPNRMTELLGVKLYGQTLLKDEFNVELESTRARVFAYSGVNGTTNPVEFTYYPSVDRYLGFIVGDDIQVEVRGPNFYLTDIEFEIQDGGRV
jgi:hypothetical protein